MESPPPYQPKKKSTGLIVGLIIGGVLLCCGVPIIGIAIAGFWGFNKIGPIAKCGMSIEALGEAVIAFADDNGGKLPNAATWQDQVKPYYAKEAAKKKNKENPFGMFPVEGEWGCEAEDNVATGIAFNTALSGKKLADITDRSKAILLFETNQRKRNQSLKWDVKTLSNLPKRFGKSGIFVATADGQANMVDQNGRQQDVNFRGGMD
ncbi:MAG: hypothetical protein ACAH95_12460 [Fimbriimonas sp.]